MRVCYIDCCSGIAGDMLLAALIDAGADLAYILTQLGSIQEISNQWSLEGNYVKKSLGLLSAFHVKVKSAFDHEPLPPPGSESSQSHDHDHDHSHSHSLDHNHDHDHSQSHSHDHDHSKASSSANSHPENQSFQQDHRRGLNDIVRMISNSTLPERVKSQSIHAFTELAYAEATVHGTSIENVHFHEVGAIDSIIDTVGCIIALHSLCVDKVYCSALPMSSGTVWTAHGMLPVPAPATLCLMKDMTVVSGPKDVTGELVTPTGASLIRALCELPSLNIPERYNNTFVSSVVGNQGKYPSGNFVIKRMGIGAGTKDFPNHPNIVRVIIGDVFDEEIPNYIEEKLYLIETNIDDMTSESMGYITEKLLIKESVNDVWVEQIYMKKNRPAFKLCVLVNAMKKDTVLKILFEETTSIGLRVQLIDRISLRREMVVAETFYGPIQIKVCFLDNRIVTTKPEYDHCKTIAETLGIPLKDVIEQAQLAASKLKQSMNIKK